MQAACQCKIFIRSKINQHHKTFILKYVHSQFTSKRESESTKWEIVQITNKCILQRRAQRKWVYDMTLPLKAINLWTKNGRKTAQQEANRSCCHRGKYDSLNRKFMMISLRWKCLYFCTKSLFNMFGICWPVLPYLAWTVVCVDWAQSWALASNLIWSKLSHFKFLSSLAINLKIVYPHFELVSAIGFRAK